jgi:hypothetical protein
MKKVNYKKGLLNSRRKYGRWTSNELPIRGVIVKALSLNWWRKNM